MKYAESHPYSTTTDDGLYDIHVIYNGFMTMIDGKVLKANTLAPSYQHCPFCHYKQSEFDDWDSFEIIDDFVKFGLRLKSSQIWGFVLTKFAM